MTDETIELFYLWYDFWVLDFSLRYKHMHEYIMER